MIYGIRPNPLGVKHKPFIKDERYVKAGKNRKRLAKNLKNREYFTVGYPVLEEEGGQLRYSIWEGNGGRTFEEATAYLDYRLKCFKAQVEFLEQTGHAPRAVR